MLNRLGPFRFVLPLVLALLAIFTAFRVGFVLAFLPRLREVPDFLSVLPIGLRYDVIITTWIATPVALALLLLPHWALLRLRVPLVLYAASAVALALFLELASVGFLDEYDSRPNRLFLEYLHQSREVTSTILAQYPLLVAVSVIAVAGVAWLVGRSSERQLRALPVWSTRQRLLALPLALAVLYVGARGGQMSRAVSRAGASFSTNHLANELGLNSIFSLGVAFMDLRLERSPEDLYGDMPFPEVLSRVERVARIDGTNAGDASIPLLHEEVSTEHPDRPLNLVLILEESLGAQFVGSLGGLPLTPNLDALSRESLWFTSLYATGTRTVRGLEATVAGFPPTPSTSVVKLGLSQHNFFTMGELLRRQGYATDYVYGGESHFDNMLDFLRGNGFEKTYDQDSFGPEAFVGTWGVSDEDLFRKANEIFVGHGSKPFFGFVLTTSNHEPFEFPDGRIELYDKKKATRNNAVKYADHAIGTFFERARKEEYFKHTVFVLCADHDLRAPSDDLLPVNHFHIPALMIAPGLAPRPFDKVASQIDLMPTALHLMGLATKHPMPGRDLLALPADDPGRAILQYYEVNGYLSGERLVVHRPFSPPLQFLYRGGKLESVPVDAELERDALAHVLLPWVLYQEQRYHLPGLPAVAAER